MATRARREREKEERRQSILRAAHEVFFENGFHRATVENVAEQAEVSKGTVYLYFESKETILAHLLLEGLDELLDELEQAYAATSPLPADERLRRLSQAYLQFFKQEPEYFRLLVAMDRGRFQDSVTSEVYEQVFAASLDGLGWVAQAIQQGIEEQLFRYCDAQLAASVIWATLNGVLELMEHPLRREMVGVEQEALYQTALEIIIQGLKAALSE
ncbi:MAG TPA: TetR/AcrR family transcriptional regulator [Chloroflexi bacterium]|nr:TetR/AcrR family transcriptional regulator [Chloroflexota bacterium]